MGALRGFGTLRELVRRFPQSLVKQSQQGGGTYVPHGDVTQRMLSTLGLFDFEIVEVVRGTAIGFKSSQGNEFPTRENAIVGCIARLAIYHEDGATVIREVGTVSNPAMDHDGENLKKAASDALKRCAMRVGVGLHLWTDGTYYLDKPGSPFHVEEGKG